MYSISQCIQENTTIQIFNLFTLPPLRRHVFELRWLHILYIQENTHDLVYCHIFMVMLYKRLFVWLVQHYLTEANMKRSQVIVSQESLFLQSSLFGKTHSCLTHTFEKRVILGYLMKAKVKPILFYLLNICQGLKYAGTLWNMVLIWVKS